MLAKMIFVAIDCLAVFELYFTFKATDRINEQYAKWLCNALKAGMSAIFANMLIAFSFNTTCASIAYSAYFASIDWIIFYMVAFCLSYTEHYKIIRKLAKYAFAIMLADSISMIANLFLGHAFYIFETTDPTGAIFYQTGFYFPYYIHLAIDYIALAVALVAIVYRICKWHSMYRTKYVMILFVLLLVVALNVIYMAAGLLLDASVVFYAVAGTLIYFSIRIFVPRAIMLTSIGRAIDDMNEGLILFDISKNCIYANAFSKKRFNIDEAEFGFECEPVKSVINALDEQGNEYGEYDYIEKRSENGNSEDMHYRIRYNELTDRKGIKIGSYFLIEDTTKMTAYLEEIREAKNTADAANRAKSSFLANMSHEIRTPLNSVIGLNEMILRSTDDPQLKEYADNIRTSGETLLGLINDILDFSKIEANRMEVHPVDYSPHKLLRECMLNFSQLASENGLYLSAECDESIPSKLTGDEKMIKQIMTNLISNAIKYTQKGGVTIGLDSRNTDTGCDIKIDVRDTGMGIAAADINTLFDAFKRVNEKKNATIQGTGLGLAITKDLVGLMGGNITVESTVGKGSVFSVILPQKIADETPSGVFSLSEGGEKGGKYTESFHAPDAHILVVDDSLMNLKVAKALLRNTLIQIDTASGGEQAIEMCLKNKYDMILLDHRMPEPDGIEVFKVISAKGVNTDTPVVMLTANAISGAEEEYRDLGFAGYLSKPIRAAELEKELVKLLPKEKVIRSFS